MYCAAFFPFNVTHAYSVIPQLTLGGLQGQQGCLCCRALERGSERISRHVSLCVNEGKKALQIISGWMGILWGRDVHKPGALP